MSCIQVLNWATSLFERYILSVMDNQLGEANVLQQENNGFGPLSKPRGKTATYTSVAVVVLSTVLLVFSVKKKDSIKELYFPIFTATLLTLSVIVGELVRRMCLFFEEIRHNEARYQGNWKRAFKTTFAFKYGGCILVVAVGCVLVVCFTLYVRNEFCHPTFAILFSLNCFVVPQLLYLVGLRELSPVETSDMNERENKNVADGLAWSYYFGYLKLVLPWLENKIGESSEFRKKITIKKLFILLPKNCAAGNEIFLSDPRVTVADTLAPLEINRAGIKKRSYKHTVHKIVIPRPDKREIEEENVYHCVVEYATPLLSLYEMSRHPEACFSRQERDHQVVLFTRKLKEILDSCKDCRGKYVLVPFSGEDNIIADVLVQMHKDANLQLDDEEGQAGQDK